MPGLEKVLFMDSGLILPLKTEDKRIHTKSGVDIINVSLEEAKTRLILDKPTLWISISDPGITNYIPLQTKDNLIYDVIPLSFKDIEGHAHNTAVMDEIDADVVFHNVISFYKKYKESKNCQIVINCWAGISRSASIAWALAEYFGFDDAETFYKTHFHPNMHVYKTMKKKINGTTAF